MISHQLILSEDELLLVYELSRALLRHADKAPASSVSPALRVATKVSKVIHEIAQHLEAA